MSNFWGAYHFWLRAGFLSHLFNMIYIFERAKRFDYLFVRLVFFQLRAVYRYRYRIDAQSRADIREVRFDVVYSQPEAADDRDKVLKIFAALELEVDLKVVRAVLEVYLKRREAGEDAEQENIDYNSNSIEPSADYESEDSSGPESGGGRQSLYLTAGAEQYRVAADHRGADYRRRR